MRSTDVNPSTNRGKIFALFALIFLGFIAFVSGMIHTATAKKNSYNFVRTITEVPLRGTIYSQDKKVLAKSARYYYVAIDGRYIAKEKQALVATMLSTYLSIPTLTILEAIQKRERVVLSKSIDLKKAEQLKELSYTLLKENAFIWYTGRDGRQNRRGFEIAEYKTERITHYGELLQPVLGYIHHEKDKGLNGLERFYDHLLKPATKGQMTAPKDVGGNLILNNHSQYQVAKRGSDMVLYIDTTLQSALERMVSEQRKQFDADEVLVAVMDAQSGALHGLVSSNRFEQGRVTHQTKHNMTINAIYHQYEPGSVMKPFILAYLLEKGEVGVFDIFDVHDGRWRLENKTIIDDHPFKWLSAEDIIVYSSNIGVAQMAQRISPYHFRELLFHLGFGETSGVDLPYEKVGKIQPLGYFKSPIVKATAGYGYGFTVNFMQMLKLYNAVNNDGNAISPHLVKRVASAENHVHDVLPESKRLFSLATTLKLQKILRKTVLKGTGRGAITEGLYIAGKTGTAHIAQGKGYENIYNSSFMGFANDGGHRYTIGVIVRQPKGKYFASQTAVPIFKKSVDILVKLGWLSPQKVIKEN